MTSNAGGRYVFDTNVIVSALLFSTSKPNRALLIALNHGVVLVSLSLLKELQSVLGRPKFDRYITREEREQFLAAFARESVLVEVIEDIQVCRDPKDDMVLNAAVNGSATCIVTGDADLLALHPFRDIPILTPDAFLTTYGDDEAAQ